MSGAPFRIFEVTGVELEYMIVDAETLDVRPVADRLLAAVGGGYELEVALGPISWSNELALHVVELKTTAPVPSLHGLAGLFQDHVGRIDRELQAFGARLLPGGMHPWMAPDRELRLWPHEANDIYATFDRIFDCRGHGWANLQSVHVNLPFDGDEEFGRLHAAIRLVLPILPALAASSPYADGEATGLMDTRLEAYRHNARRVPSVSGRVIPERVFTRADYEHRLLAGIYADLAPLDPDGILRHEWVNARGCIARFDRMSIEIRVIDVQECPQADLAVTTAVTGAVAALANARWVGLDELQAWSEDRLEAIMLDCIRDGDEARLADPAFLRAFGYPGGAPSRARDLWQHLIDSAVAPAGRDEGRAFFRMYSAHGCLARRIRSETGAAAARAGLMPLYRRLADCLAGGQIFDPAQR